MTIHAFTGGKASRTHENLIFQDFLDHIAQRWAESTDWIYVISNALWNGAEIDLVCILPDMLVVADFKSHRGELVGGENGRWRTGGVEVKGGSYPNPFLQLRANKRHVINWLEQHDLLPGQELGHTSALALFGGPIKDKVDLPGRVRSWFHITDLEGCAKRLDLLASPSLRVSQEQAGRIVAQLGVEPYRWTRASVHPLGEVAGEPALKASLTEGQQQCLNQVVAALRDPDVRSLSVTGMTSTGKTFLMQHLAGVLDSEGIPYQVLYPNSRLAGRVRGLGGSHLECSSVYRHLYFREVVPSEQVVKEAAGSTTSSKDSSGTKKRAIKRFPLLSNRDPENVVYLVDDAHLLGNGYFETIDGKVFGSGYLVNDLFRFTDFASNDRKVVFFGDNYQLPRMSVHENLLEGRYQEAAGLKHLSLELEQVYDPGDGRARLKNAIQLVDAMRSGRYSVLELEEDESFRVIDRRQAAEEILQEYRSDPYACWTLFFSNAQVNKFTGWVRTQLLGPESNGIVAVGEVLESVHPFREVGEMETGSALYRGRRVTVSHLSPVKEISMRLRGRDQDTVFQVVPEVSLEAPGLDAATCRIDNLLLQYFEQDEATMSADVVLAAGIWFRTERKKKQGDDSGAAHTEEPSDQEASGIEGVSLMQYGYAATVHHAQGMKQPWCYVDGHHQARSQSAGYFRWLYTALTVAEKGVVLFNYAPIHAFTGMVWKPGAAKSSDAIRIGYGWAIQERALTADEEQQEVPPGLAESPRLRLSAAVWLKVLAAVKPLGWKVVAVKSSTHLEKLTLEGPEGQATLSVSYDSKQVVSSMRLDEKAHGSLLCQLAEACVLSSEFTPLAQSLLAGLQDHLAPAQWRIVSARETAWRLSLVVARTPVEMVEMQLNFDKAGRATTMSVVNFAPGVDVAELGELLQ